MKRNVFGNCVQGASHKRTNLECQDSYKRIELDDNTVIMAVADGHGSNSSPYSKTGSTIAVNVFCKVISEYIESYSGESERLLTFLNREGDTKIAQAIDAEWKRRVLKAHKDKKREVPLDANGEKDKVAIYRLYGSTLVGLVITTTYVFAFQLGDGDITYVDDSGIDKVLQSDKILGTETHSLCKPDSWKRAITAVRRRDIESSIPCMFMLSTDGFSNSYKSEQEFEKTCIEYFEMIKQYGVSAVEASLSSWLAETSELGCGDDITVLIAHYAASSESGEAQHTDVPEGESVNEQNS